MRWIHLKIFTGCIIHEKKRIKIVKGEGRGGNDQCISEAH